MHEWAFLPAFVVRPHIGDKESIQSLKESAAASPQGKAEFLKQFLFKQSSDDHTQPSEAYKPEKAYKPLNALTWSSVNNCTEAPLTPKLKRKYA